MELKDKLVYWEKRTINIGDYESIECGLNYTSNIKKINEKESTIQIFEYDSSELDLTSIDEDNEHFINTVKLMQKRVRSTLNAREADIRLRANEFTEHSSIKKALIFRIIDAVKYRAKHKKLKVEMKEADKLVNELSDGALSVFDDE